MPLYPWEGGTPYRRQRYAEFHREFWGPREVPEPVEEEPPFVSEASPVIVGFRLDRRGVLESRTFRGEALPDGWVDSPGRVPLPGRAEWHR